MKRAYKKTVVVLSLVVLCLSLTGCYSFERSSDGRFTFGVNKSRFKRDAFCIGLEWNGGDTSFVIPDEFNGYKVTTLGGYTGRGYPCPFGVRIGGHLDELYGEGVYGRTDDISDLNPEDEYDLLKFSVHLGANLTEVYYTVGKVYYMRRTETEDGASQEDLVCKIVYYFTVDEANPKLYAEDGKLYYRNGDKPVEDFFYA